MNRLCVHTLRSLCRYGFLFFLSCSFVGCLSEVDVSLAPSTLPSLNSKDIIASSILVDNENVIALTYDSVTNTKATSCTALDLVNLSISSLCTCDVEGVCQLGVTGDLSFIGTAQFSYSVSSGSTVSNISKVEFEVIPSLVTWPSFDFDIYIGIEDSTWQNLVYQLHFDNLAPLGTALSVVNSGPVVLGGQMRTMTMNVDGDFLVGDDADSSPPIYSKNIVFQRNTSPIGAPDAEINSHTLCSLPNGNYIISEFNAASGNVVNEYDENDNFLRNVYTTVLTGFSVISECYSPDTTTVILVEANASALDESNIMEMTLVGNAWVLDSSINSEVLDPGNSTNFWSMIYHSDGYIYFPPFRRDGSRMNKLLKCTSTNISVGSCSPVGDDIPNAVGGGSLTWTRASVQIPGSNDMIIFLSREAFHYDYSSGVYTSIMDLTTLPTGTNNVRAAILAPK